MEGEPKNENIIEGPIEQLNKQKEETKKLEEELTKSVENAFSDLWLKKSTEIVEDIRIKTLKYTESVNKLISLYEQSK